MWRKQMNLKCGNECKMWKERSECKMWIKTCDYEKMNRNEENKLECAS